jgi:hypothetical protein
VIEMPCTSLCVSMPMMIRRVVSGCPAVGMLILSQGCSRE